MLASSVCAGGSNWPLEVALRDYELCAPTAFKEVAAHAPSNANMPARSRKTGTGGDIGVPKLRDQDPLIKEQSAKAKGCHGQGPAQVKPVLVAQVASPSNAGRGNSPTYDPRKDLKANVNLGSPRCPTLWGRWRRVQHGEATRGHRCKMETNPATRQGKTPTGSQARPGQEVPAQGQLPYFFGNQCRNRSTRHPTTYCLTAATYRAC